jgi:mannose-6-phosphate isomerase-like protein (cupin superfamily)
MNWTIRNTKNASLVVGKRDAARWQQSSVANLTPGRQRSGEHPQQRRKLYEQLGLPMDETVDVAAMQALYAERRIKVGRWGTVVEMPIHVFDYRVNLSNLVVQPQIRSRFRRVELGPVPEVHSHDLGGETFLVMEGEIEFTVDGETTVCTAGQGIFVPPRTTHAVRAIGERPGVMYLSVSPHVEPTHTFHAADGRRLPPRYGVWRAAGGGGAPTTDSSAALLQRYRGAAAELAELARANAERASRCDVVDKASIDGLWESLRPVLQHIETVERTWNELALQATS